MRRSLRRRTPSPDVEVGPGERVLAWAETGEGQVLVGTRDAVYLAGARVPWERVEAADWDREADLFRLSEVGTWGEERVEHRFAISEPGRFLELVRERVTASLVLQRPVPVAGGDVRVVGRRAPRGGPITWYLDYDPGVDPADPAVRAATGAALTQLRGEVGEG